MSEPFTRHAATAAPLDADNVDTDQIVPAVYMKRLTKTGYADALFRRWRDDDPGFVLNRPEFAEASILVAGSDFGIGSSREHAVWALRDYGFRAVLAAGFGDIFSLNATKNGVLTVDLSAEEAAALRTAVRTRPNTVVTIDLTAQTVGYDEHTVSFTIDPEAKHQLLTGLDDIEVTTAKTELISAFETRRRGWLPRTR